MKKNFFSKINLVTVCIVSISISLALLIPNTFAYFSDVIENKGNTITSASMNFDVSYEDENGEYVLLSEDNEAISILSNALNLQIKNTSIPQIKFRLSVIQNDVAVNIIDTSTYIYIEPQSGNTESFPINLASLSSDEFTVKVEYRYSTANELDGYSGDIKEYNFKYVVPTVYAVFGGDNSFNNYINNESVDEPTPTAEPTPTSEPTPTAEPTPAVEPNLGDND